MRDGDDWIALEKELVGQDDHYPVKLPNFKRGDWQLDDVKVDGSDILQNLRYIRDGLPECIVTPGKYKRLCCKNSTVMSNTQMEYRTNCDFVETAYGAVLVSGLGMGMILLPLAKRKIITSITVLEQSQDLIDAVAPYYQERIPTLEVICADAMQWRPAKGRTFDWAWHDIWPSFGSDYIKKYTAIKRHHHSWVKVQQGCWAENLSRRMQRIERS